MIRLTRPQQSNQLPLATLAQQPEKEYSLIKQPFMMENIRSWIMSAAVHKVKGETEQDAVTDDSYGSLHNEDDGFTELCQKLKENDTKVTTIKIGDASMNDKRALALGQSLRGNTKVNTIVIDFGFVHKFCGSAFCLLDYIETSPSLLAVEVQNTSMADGAAWTILLVLVLTVGKNPAIKEFTLDSHEAVYLDTFTALFFAAASVAVRAKRNLAHFPMALAASFRECHHLESLWLEHLDNNVLCRLLSELQTLKSLKLLVIVPNKHYSVATFSSLGVLLMMNRSIEHLELHGCQFSAKLLDPVVRGLAKSPTVAELSFHDCSLDWAATNIFQEIFVESPTSKNSIHTLMLGHNMKFNRSTATVLSTIVTAPNCSLTALDLCYCDLGGQKGIEELLTALASKHRDDWIADLPLNETATIDETRASKAMMNAMERLLFGTMHSEGELDVLKKMIPKVYGLREISVKLGTHLFRCKEHLLVAFKTSTTLEKCTIDDEEFILRKQPMLQIKNITFQSKGSANIVPDEPESQQPEGGAKQDQLQGIDRVLDFDNESTGNGSEDDAEASHSDCGDRDDTLQSEDVNYEGFQGIENAPNDVGVEKVIGSEQDEDQTLVDGGVEGSSQYDETTVDCSDREDEPHSEGNVGDGTSECEDDTTVHFGDEDDARLSEEDRSSDMKAKERFQDPGEDDDIEGSLSEDETISQSDDSGNEA
jgi:hypothetical protein